MFTTLKLMIRTGILTEPLTKAVTSPPAAETLQHDLWNVLGRALCIRHVDAGSCNGCELEIHALNNPYYNLEGASSLLPAHAMPICCWSPDRSQ
jgi:hypothetical protein